MNKQKEFAKISVLIDKLNYLNDNLDYNNFNPNNIDFRLLKKYVDDIHLKLNEISITEESNLQQEIKQNVIVPIHSSVNTSDHSSINITKKEMENIKEEDSYSTIEQKLHIEEELVPHKDAQAEFSDKTTVNSAENDSDIPVGAINIEENSTQIKSLPEPLAESIEKDEKVDNDSKLYDLYEMNDNTSSLTKVSDIVNNEALNQNQNENIQQDILKTINAIKGDKKDFEPSDNTQIDKKPVKEPDSLDSIIVDSNVFEQKIEKNNEVDAIQKTNKISFDNNLNDEDDLAEENGKPSLNDLFKDEKKNVADAISKPVVRRNLKDIIDINDRFQFIQTLFGGSYLGFEEAVGTVSKQSNYSEALDFIDQKLKSTYNWDSDSKVVDKFLTLVEKCYEG